MSEALSITHDALVGHWDGVPQVGDIGKPRDFKRLAYLSSPRRMQLLMADVSCHFQVVKNRTNVQLKFGDNVVCVITPPTQALLRNQLVYVRNYADLRTDRIAEINIQATDILSFFGAQFHLNGEHRRCTLELLTVVQSLAIQLEMVAKHHCWLPRPTAMSPNIQPMVQTPDHSTFPSGHATESFAVATVLHRLSTGASAIEGLMEKSMPYRLAHRIAVNRTVAGLHFPVDSAAGAMLGCAIGEALYSIYIGGPVSAFTFGSDGYNLDPRGSDKLSRDFTLQSLGEYAAALAENAPDEKAKVPRADLFKDFWDDASREFGNDGRAGKDEPEDR